MANSSGFARCCFNTLAISLQLQRVKVSILDANKTSSYLSPGSSAGFAQPSARHVLKDPVWEAYSLHGLGKEGLRGLELGFFLDIISGSGMGIRSNGYKQGR